MGSSVLWWQDHFSPEGMWVIIHRCHQVDFIFCFSCGKATDTEKMTIKHALSGSCGGWFLHHHVKNNLETINLQHWWWCFCGSNALPPAALMTLLLCCIKNNFETINLWHWWWCFCSGNAMPPVALMTLLHFHFLAAFCQR